MNDEDKELIGKTFYDMLMSIDIITETLISIQERVERLEEVVVQIAKIQGGGKDVIHPN